MNKFIKQTLLLTTIGLTAFAFTSYAPNILQKAIMTVLLIHLYVGTSAYLIYGILYQPARAFYYTFLGNGYEITKIKMPEVFDFKLLIKSIGKYLARFVALFILYGAVLIIGSNTNSFLIEKEQTTSQVLVSFQ
ncbi:hypothetical protein [Pseudomonas sp. MF6747]|uniref:hypothetical protein n=1 Tax=Pseudomonas sp. MF6747 TaxID=2797527 RepID=UPI00190BF5E4|nr:hypothetical protein [Pseudomonas sp. MF6747]MBK3506781.1 hypothetical protein [Pseudomonas sp. MF6747]